MLKIYGSPRTSAGRCYLMLEEVGQPYEAIVLDMAEKREHKSAEYMKLNPNGKVPCLKDGDFVIWESIAINNYLADKFKPELLGQNAQERALILQWNLWGMGELQAPLIDIVVQKHFVPDEHKDPRVILRAQEKLPSVLRVLDEHLKESAHLAGERLTVADLNMATVMNTAKVLETDLAPYTHIEKWFSSIRQRPSFVKFLSIRRG
jgi:glutathione S-transferase